MAFWIGLDIGLIFIFLLTTLFVSEKNKKHIAMFVIGVLTFLSAFRYGVATDYESYELLFYSLQSDNTPKEISFAILVESLRNIGFSAQMMFLIYSCFTSVFMWKGFRYYFNTNQQLLLASTLYGIMVIFWFESMNGIRQWLAMAVFLWSTKFILEGMPKKFFLSFITTVLIHFGAIVTIISLWIKKVQISKRMHVCLVIFSIGIVYIIDIPSLILSILIFSESFLGVGSQYIGYLSNIWLQDSFAREGGTGLGAMFYIGIYFVILFMLRTKNKLENYICNMVTISILIRTFFWFSTPFLRLRGFFEMFLLMGTIFCVERFHKDSQLFVSFLFILAYAIVKWGFLYQISTTQMINIEYQMNFNLLQ